MEIQVKHRQGMSIKAIDREMGLSRNTVRKCSVPLIVDRLNLEFSGILMMRENLNKSITVHG